MNILLISPNTLTAPYPVYPGSGGAAGAAMISKLHDRGFIGPLWEHLAQ